jgi:ornithine cyclodeaminase
MNKNWNILIIDDDVQFSSLISKWLQTENYNVTMAHNTNESKNKINKEDIHLVLIDAMLANEDGINLCKELRRENDNLFIILFKSQKIDPASAIESGADIFINKPFELETLLESIKKLESSNLQKKPQPHHQTKILFAKDIADIIKQKTLPLFFNELVNRLKYDFTHWDLFHINPRLASHYPEGVIELMPTTTKDHYAFKYVNGHPANTKKHNTLNIIGFGALANTNTGIPYLITDMTLLTALRTAATSSLAALHLARQNATTMALIGTGAQSEFQALAFHYVNGIQTIKFFDINTDAMNKFRKNLQSTNIKLIACQSIEEAIKDADIITTATAAKKHTQLFSLKNVNPGTMINSIGGDCPGKTELGADIIYADLIAVDFLEQAKVEGEIQHLDNHSNIIQLSDIVAGDHPGRQNNDEITLFDSVGCAVEDFSTLFHINELAEEYNIGDRGDFIANPKDPKDLFSLLA